MVSTKFAGSSNFHLELKKRINEYFDESGKLPSGNIKLYSKAFILIFSFVLIFTHLVLVKSSLWIAIPEAMLLGILTSFIGFNIMHDGAHGSFSKHKWINKLAASTLNFLGANSFMWNSKHNIVHHAYTNIDGIDDDINAGPFLRLSESQKYYKFHKYQHIYFWMVYSLLYIFWIFFSDYKKYFTHKVGNVPLQKMKLKDHIAFWTFKVVHLGLFFVIPVYTWGLFAWFIGFLIYTMTSGLVLSIVFQLAHTVEETQFPLPSENHIKDEWAVHQLKTTANFATGNKFISWCLGGLNFQIEHHLFPKISHVHYPEISSIIRNVCEKYGINYIEHPKMSMAISSHINHLRNLGRRS